MYAFERLAAGVRHSCIKPAAFVNCTVLIETQQHGMQLNKDDRTVGSTVKSKTVQDATHACLCITEMTDKFDQIEQYI